MDESGPARPVASSVVSAPAPAPASEPAPAPADAGDASDLEPADLLALVKCGRDLASQVVTEKVLQSILDNASVLTDSPDTCILLYHEQKKALYFAAATGENAPMLLQTYGEFGEKVVPLDTSKAGEVFTSGKSETTDRIQNDPKHFKGVDADTKKSTQSMVCVALTCAGERLGVLQILNKRQGNYTKRDRDLIENFAGQAAIAVRNARLFDRLLAHMGLYASRTRGQGPLELLRELTLPARKERMTVLFADMRGFTQLCQVVGDPEETQLKLNEFVGMLAAGVLRHDGLVNKFLGDGMLALFRGPEHEKRSVRCAFDVVERFGEVKRRWDAASSAVLEFLDLGVGIATDNVIIGTIGGEGGVRDFTVVGTCVNLAAALEHRARGGKRVLVDRMTYRAVADAVESEGPEPIELKKPDQKIGHPFEYYHLKRLLPPQSAAGAAGGAAGRAARRSGNLVFISYAHKDREWFDRFKVHLGPYVREGSLSVWGDTQLEMGSKWREAIDKALKQAKVALLLVSPDFLDSEFITRNELPPLLEAAETEGLTIAWVPVRHSAYGTTKIKDFQSAWPPDRPLNALPPSELEQAMADICQKLKGVAGRG